MHACILNGFWGSKRKLLLLGLPLFLGGLGSAWWAAAQVDLREPPFDPASHEAALLALRNPAEFSQLLERSKTPAQRQRDAQASWFLIHPEEYDRQSDKAISLEERHRQERALQAIQSPQAFALEQNAALTPQEIKEQETCLQWILTLQGPSTRVPEPAPGASLNPPTLPPPSN